MSTGQQAVYLVAGPDFGRREQAIKKIRAGLEERVGDAAEGVEYLSYYADDIPVAELVTRLYNRPLFHAHLLAVYRVDALRGADHQRLKQYMAAPSAVATLILVSEEPTPAAAWARAIPKSATIVCWQPFSNEITATIRQLFQSHGKRISTQLIEDISALSAGDSHLAEQLTMQIIYFFHAQPEITAKLLFEFIEKQHATSIFQLTGHLFARDTREAIATLHHLHAEQVSSNHIAGFVNMHMQKLWRVAYLMANGIPSAEALKSNGVVWKRQVQSFQRGLKHFTLVELSRLLNQHKALEAQIRQLPEQYAYLLVTQMILQVCAGPAAPLVPDRNPSLIV